MHFEKSVCCVFSKVIANIIEDTYLFFDNDCLDLLNIEP